MGNDKLISAEALFLSVRDDPEINGKNFVRMKEHIDNAPDAVKRGRWVQRSNSVFDCSICNITTARSIPVKGVNESELWNYCPNCGAKMDGERRSDE